jgi:predicted amidohydrolase
MMFPEAAAALALGGAEILLHPTGGYGWYDAIGEATLRTRANDNSVYIVTAKNYVHNGAGNSGVVDPWGHLRASAGFAENGLAVCEIDLDLPKTQPAWFYPTVMSGEARVGVRKLAERRPGLYGPLTAPGPAFAPPDAAARARLRDCIRKGECRW